MQSEVDVRSLQVYVQRQNSEKVLVPLGNETCKPLSSIKKC